MLTLRYRKERERECAWILDPALVDVPESVKADWMKDGSIVHLQPYAKNGALTVISVRDLEADEARYVRRYISSGQVLIDNVFFECFALGARFKGQPDEQVMPDGTRVDTIERDANGFLRLSRPFMNGVDRDNPGLVNFIGNVILNGSFPSAIEKKASSPQSTEKPSSTANGTSPSTEDGEPVAAV